MLKRKDRNNGDEDGDSDVSLVHVDFEFFDPTETDFLALKRLLVQLFQSDADFFDVHKLSELILSQPLLGTTVKTDGIESDPYAFLTVVNMNVHIDHPSIQAFVSYANAKFANNPSFLSIFQSSLHPQSKNHIGLIVSERLINMPVQVVPPMYRLLGEEIKQAVEDNEPYAFDQFLFISRTYRMPADDVMEGVESTGPATKRHKNGQKNNASKHDPHAAYSFHNEDECVAKFATHIMDYDFTNRQAREPDSFGVDTAGRMMLVPADRLPSIIAEMMEAYPAPTPAP